MGSVLEKNSSAVRKRIESHSFADEEGEEYGGSAFGGFGDYFRRKKIKLQNLDSDLRAASQEKPQIFKGVVAHVSGYTQPPLHVLHKDLVQYGAGFLQYLDSKTMATHIIASSLPPKKQTEFSRYRIVKPAWVVDSIKAGKMLPWNDYKVIDDGPRQKTIKLGGGKMLSQTSQQSPLRYREQTQSSFYTSQFQKNASGGSQTAASPLANQAPRSARRPPEVTMDDEVDDEMDSALLELAQDPSLSGVQTTDFAGEHDLDDIQMSDIDDAAFDGQLPPEDDENIPQLGREVSKPTNPAASKPKAMTSEEHNAWLLSDPKLRKSSTANPNFLKQFYSESRLHHLSTWKAELKSKMQQLATEKGSAPKTLKRKPGARRYIMHVDFDSFFCAVSLKRAPEYVDKPAVVAHGTGTGSEIASCNYPARKFGVKNGMWMKRALEMCPEIKVLPYDFPAYEEASKLFYEAILEVGGVVQSVSVDEALVDITSLVLSAAGSEGVGVDEGSIWREQDKANDIATRLRQQIKDKTGCSVSIGIGNNILLAKVALRKGKPAGQYQIKPEEVLDRLGDLKVDDLPSVAYSINGKLEEIGVKLVKDLRALSKERLISVLGPKTGEKLWEYSRGIDKTEVGDQPIRKSVSAEVNWGIRFVNQEEAEDFIMNLCKELEKRLLNEQVKGKSLTMKIMRRCLDAPLDPAKHLGHGKCDTFNKSVVFGVATNNAELIGKEAVSILRTFKFSPGDLRGLGVQLQKLEPIKTSKVAPDGSQKKLSFGAFAATTAKKVGPEDAKGPERFKPMPRSDDGSDPITDDPLTPRKPRLSAVHPALALAKAGEADSKAMTPLNTSGTQFIMPSNPDSAVLAELPPDIRSRLMAQQKKNTPLRKQPPNARSRTQSPALQDELPPEVDPEVFNALPEDMKAEVLASYGRRGGQRLLPQSPRKDRVIRHPPLKKTPTKRGGIRGMLNKTRERQHDAQAKLLQTNFMSSNRRGRNEPQQPDDGIEELDQAFLSELPEDLRKEVIEDHRRRRLAQRSGLNFQAPQRRARQTRAVASGEARLQFPRRLTVAFTGTSLTSMREVKDMLSAWYQETQDDGPHHEDVEVFEKYLARVVTEEKDLDKARRLINWLEWLVEDHDNDGRGKRSWKSSVSDIKSEIQNAVKARGFAPMLFE